MEQSPSWPSQCQLSVVFFKNWIFIFFAYPRRLVQLIGGPVNAPCFGDAQVVFM